MPLHKKALVFRKSDSEKVNLFIQSCLFSSFAKGLWRALVRKDTLKGNDGLKYFNGLSKLNKKLKIMLSVKLAEKCTYSRTLSKQARKRTASETARSGLVQFNFDVNIIVCNMKTCVFHVQSNCEMESFWLWWYSTNDLRKLY